MKNNIRILHRYMAAVLIACLFFSGCTGIQNTVEKESAATTISATVQSEHPQETTAEIISETVAPELPEETETEPSEPIVAEPIVQETISVAIYPYLPDVELFERVLIQEWGKLEPSVALTVERWDCYGGFSNCDVLMYDALLLTYMAEHNMIQPIDPQEIDKPEGLIPFALEGSIHNDTYYGVPYLLCGDVLIYFKDDAEAAKIDNVPELYAEVQRRQNAGETAGVVVGTLIENPYHYLDALIDTNGQYTAYEQLPDCTNLNQEAVQRLRELNAIALAPPFDPAAELPSADEISRMIVQMFCEGKGFAFFGVTENMSYMTDLLDEIAIKPISYSDAGNVPMYYVDVTSIATHVTEPEKLELCKKLMNMVGSEAFMEALFLESDQAQYLLPARENVYLTLAKKYPVYERLHEIAMDEENKAFRVGEDFATYINTFPNIFG